MHTLYIYIVRPALVLPSIRRFILLSFGARLWLSTFKGSVAVDGPQLDLTLSVASAELWEYLYRNQAKLNHITKPISVSPVRPSVRLTVWSVFSGSLLLCRLSNF